MKISRKPTVFELKVLQTVKNSAPETTIDDLCELYNQATTSADKVHICAILGMQTAAYLKDRGTAESYLTEARQHAIDRFDDLCYLTIVKDVIENLLSDPLYRHKMNLTV